MDPETAAVMADVEQRFADVPVPERGDWKTLRDNGNANQKYLATIVPPAPNVRSTSFFTTADDGASIELRWFTKDGANPRSAVVYLHGGGLIIANVVLYGPWVSWYVQMTGVPFLSVEYRLAPEATGTMPAEDAFAGLTWLIEHAAELGVDPSRVAIMGDSAGGGIAAGAAILARDRRVPLARQILVYPMLDDREPTPQAAIEPFLTWTHDNEYPACPLPQGCLSQRLTFPTVNIGPVSGGGFELSRTLYALSVLVVVAYVLRGWSVSGTGLRGLVDLALAPVYVAWKVTSVKRKPARADAEWVRTTRE